MQPVYYDFHIHTALSPCADDDMVPGDIAGMAILNGLDAIAVTDHNSMANAKAVCEAAKAASAAHGLENELIVLPGIEVTTAEEVHVVCLFDSIGAAEGFEAELSCHYPQMKNREDIFGKQIIMSADDNAAGIMERMLIAPTTITFEGLYALTRKHGGAFVPAHVDRGSFSVMSNLGFLPPDLDIATIEYTSRTASEQEETHDYSLFPGKKAIYSSDAHQLHIINEKKHFILLQELSAKEVVNYMLH